MPKEVGGGAPGSATRRSPGASSLLGVFGPREGERLDIAQGIADDHLEGSADRCGFEEDLLLPPAAFAHFDPCAAVRRTDLHDRARNPGAVEHVVGRVLRARSILLVRRELLMGLNASVPITLAIENNIGSWVSPPYFVLMVLFYIREDRKL